MANNFGPFDTNYKSNRSPNSDLPKVPAREAPKVSTGATADKSSTIRDHVPPGKDQKDYVSGPKDKS